MTTQEVITDAEVSEDVFVEDLEINENNPRSRLRIRSRKVVLSVGGGEAVVTARPPNQNQIIEQVDGVNESDSDDIETIDDQKDDNKNSDDVIEEIDGGIETSVTIEDETTITFDLTISAHQLVDAYCSIEDNLCHSQEDNEKIPFISEIPSSEELDGENILFTLEVQIKNEEKFLKKVLNRFDTWDPLYFKKPRGKLVKVLRRN